MRVSENAKLYQKHQVQLAIAQWLSKYLENFEYKLNDSWLCKTLCNVHGGRQTVDRIMVKFDKLKNAFDASIE